MWKCLKCNMENDGLFCSHCGASKPDTEEYTKTVWQQKTTYSDTPDAYDTLRTYEEQKSTSGNSNIIKVTICVMMILMIIIIFILIFLLNSSKKNNDSQNKKDEPKVTAEVTTAPSMEPTPTPAQSTSISTTIDVPSPTPYKTPEPVVDTREADVEMIKRMVEGYLINYVNAMNSGNPSYMLPYVIDGCPLYERQKKFIENGWQEEFISCYLTGDVKWEGDFSCVVEVCESFNVKKTNEDLRYLRQLATYRMKKDNDGIWKMYDFVGNVQVLD